MGRYVPFAACSRRVRRLLPGRQAGYRSERSRRHHLCRPDQIPETCYFLNAPIRVKRRITCFASVSPVRPDRVKPGLTMPEKRNYADTDNGKMPVTAASGSLAPQKHRDSGNFNRRQAKKPKTCAKDGPRVCQNPRSALRCRLPSQFRFEFPRGGQGFLRCHRAQARPRLP
jgi:hypothetical protein